MCCRPARCSLARVQPALKDAMRKGAHIATLAGTLHQVSSSFSTKFAVHLPNSCPCTTKAEGHKPSGSIQLRQEGGSRSQGEKGTGAAYLAEVWAGSGYILVDCRVPSPCLLSGVAKDTEGPVVWLLVLALCHLSKRVTLFVEVIPVGTLNLSCSHAAHFRLAENKHRELCK